MVCNLEVEKIDVLPWHMAARLPPSDDILNVEEFPPFDPNSLRRYGFAKSLPRENIF